MRNLESIAAYAIHWHTVLPQGPAKLYTQVTQRRPATDMDFPPPGMSWTRASISPGMVPGEGRGIGGH